MPFNKYIPGPPVSVFGDIPELSVSSKIPRWGRVHLPEGAVGRREGWRGLQELTEGGPSRRRAPFSCLKNERWGQ